MAKSGTASHIISALITCTLRYTAPKEKDRSQKKKKKGCYLDIKDY